MSTSYRHSRGFSLLEVLVALVVLSFGILGAVAMQLAAKRGSFGALEKTQATFLANDYIERARGNALGLTAYAGTLGSGQTVASASSCSRASTCSSAALAAWDRYQWNQELLGARTKEAGSNLPVLENAVGCVSVAANLITVTLSWDGVQASSDGSIDGNCGTASNRRRQVQVKSVVW
ncbi:type IV pilus modification protein PilV [Gallaecimonas kandeliae]|uniref:type IV pilus modification protein PilV n=1 Tax=Gallaecimonas kandeliae TaxID=3029055 RepID=UPI0026480C44|nr:type IV pilus modification protein PilV [Gallaecimonas kandeliae]WKE64959.1 type IV pilus modification protein PilV [Gallaecimonas kandeliae]